MKAREAKSEDFEKYLNGGQKNVIEGTLKFVLEDYLDPKMSFEKLRPYEAIVVLKWMLGESMSILDMPFERRDDIYFVLDLFGEENLQNRAGSYPYVGQQEGFSMFHLDAKDCEIFIDKEATFKTRREVITDERREFVFHVVYKNGRVIKAENVVRLFKTDSNGWITDWDFVGKEPVGKLSLTALEDKSTLPVTKQAVVEYIKKLIKDALEIQKIRGLNYVKAVLDAKKTLTVDEISNLYAISADVALVLISNQDVASKLGMEHLKQIQKLYPDSPLSDRLQTLIDERHKEIRKLIKQSFFAVAEQEKKESAILNKLLHHVAFGEETEAEAIIKDHSELLFKVGTVKDRVGNTFENYSPVKLARYNHDANMLKMMSKYVNILFGGEAKEFVTIIEKANEEERDQKPYDFNPLLQAVFQDCDAVREAALEKFRQDFAPEPVIKYKEQFNIKTILQAYKIYQSLQTLAQEKYLKCFWVQVIGYLQRVLPACHAQLLCQGGDGIIAAGEAFKRTLKLSDGSDYYPADMNSKSGLGYDFAIFAGKKSGKPLSAKQNQHVLLFSGCGGDLWLIQINHNQKIYKELCNSLYYRLRPHLTRRY